MPMSTFVMRVPETLLAQLREAARRDGRTPSGLARHILTAALRGDGR